jgi:uncharacterized phage protein (possible DNA packaging)
MAEEKEILTLQQAKGYLRVSYDEDDEEIEGLILTAEAYIDSCVGTGYKDRANYESDEDYEKGRRIAALLQKKIISDMYEVRATTVRVNTKTDSITKTILDKLANVG